MIPKDIDQITEADLQELIENSVAERKTIEYKRELPGNKDSDKKEFLADVSSFANASGGDIIYGMEEENSLPKELKGFDIDKIDINSEILRLEQLMTSGIRPRIVGHKIREVSLSGNRVALIIRLPKSWQSPHRVAFQGHDKFYGRNTKGKYPLDVDELRVAFNLSETITERIRSFRADRIAKILADEGPVPLRDSPKVILHVLPVSSFALRRDYDIKKYYQQYGKIYFLLDKPRIDCNHRYNFEGILVYYMGEKCLEYIQIFRNGIIEAVDSYCLGIDRNGKKIIHSSYERDVGKALENYLSILKELNVDTPIIIVLSLLNVKGYAIDRAFGNYLVRQGKINPIAIERDMLLIPEVEVSNYDVNTYEVLKPCFDAIWNACGFARSEL